jgi:uncharacterized membrane protein
MKSLILKRPLSSVGWFLLLLVSLYYIYHTCRRYFIFTEASYRTHFWTREEWVFIHVVSGIVATLIVPFQLIRAFRKKYTRLHRGMGHTYLISVIISSITSFYLSVTSGFNLTYVSGFACFSLVWFCTPLMGYIAIMNGNTTQHREWMIRSYVVTLGFSIIRLLKDTLVPAHLGERMDLINTLTWISWAIPLFITELILQVRKFKKQAELIVIKSRPIQ